MALRRAAKSQSSLVRVVGGWRGGEALVPLEVLGIFFQGVDAEAYKYQVVVQIMPWVPDDHIHKETIICP